VTASDENDLLDDSAKPAEGEAVSIEPTPEISESPSSEAEPEKSVEGDSGNSPDPELASESSDNQQDSAVETSEPEDLDDDDLDDDDLDDDDLEVEGDGSPIEDIADEPEQDVEKLWYILKVQVNREKGICDALSRRIKMHGLENMFGEILVPTEDVKEFTKTGKQRIVKRKLYPGYIVVNMAINDETWFIVRETPGIGDFTGSAGKPAPLESSEIDRIIRLSKPEESEEGPAAPKIGFPFKVGDRVRVNEGNFQSLEGDVETIDESNGRITVILTMFGRPTPVQLNHWQVEKI
jgi:transcriptional antiterminator NusG